MRSTKLVDSRILMDTISWIRHGEHCRSCYLSYKVNIANQIAKVWNKIR